MKLHLVYQIDGKLDLHMIYYQSPLMLHVDLINIAYLIWHVECSSGAIRTACDIRIAGRRGAGGRVAQANMEETDGERLP